MNLKQAKGKQVMEASTSILIVEYVNLKSFKRAKHIGLEAYRWSSRFGKWAHLAFLRVTGLPPDDFLFFFDNI